MFERGGFDIVIGNPPYVRMEFIKAVKPYLAEHYVVAADRADLYAYFFEKGVRLLKDGGRLGFISSSTFFRTGSGEKLRMFLTDRVAIESVVDFGDLQLFEGVTTYPAILSLRKGGDGTAGDLSYLTLKGSVPEDLAGAFAAGASTMPRARLGAGSWRFEGDALAALRDKIADGRKTLGEVYGPPLYGIKTGLNEAFIIDAPTRDRLVKADPKSAELLKPFLRGENIKRWRVEPEGLWLINTPRGKVKIDEYPAIRDWLRPFRKDLEKRATKQEWWELQQAQLAYQPRFPSSKIVYPDITDDSNFSLDEVGLFADCTVFFVPDANHALLAYLNSNVPWFFLRRFTPELRGGYRSTLNRNTFLKSQFMVSRSRASSLGEIRRGLHRRRAPALRNHRRRAASNPGPRPARAAQAERQARRLARARFRRLPGRGEEGVPRRRSSQAARRMGGLARRQRARGSRAHRANRRRRTGDRHNRLRALRPHARRDQRCCNPPSPANISRRRA